MEAERTGDVLLGSTHENRFGPFINGQPSERNPLFCRRMIWGDFVYTTAEGFREGSVSAQAERERAGRGGVTTESVLFEMTFSLVFFLPRPVLSVKVSSDCAPLCRSLSSRLCRPRPSLRSCLARAPPSGSPDEQQ